MNALILPDEVFSTDHLNIVLNDIDRYLEKFNTKKSVGVNLNRLTVLVFEKNGISEIEEKALKDLKKYLTKLLGEAPRIDIRTAHPVIDNVQMRINDWVKNNISKNVLLSFHDDHTLLAGVLIQTPSKRLDYTLRKGLKAGREYLASEVRK